MLPASGKAGVAHPPKSLTLVGFKREKRLDVLRAGHERRYAVRQIAPHPRREPGFAAPEEAPEWTAALYKRLAAELRALP